MEHLINFSHNFSVKAGKSLAVILNWKMIFVWLVLFSFESHHRIELTWSKIRLNQCTTWV